MSVKRPLSPHLQVYRLPLTGLISISHRITGLALALGLPFCLYALYALAAGEADFLSLQQTLALWPARILFWGFVYALFFHLCHGTRHLIWDVGKSFDKAALTKFAVFELAASASMTLAAFLLL